MKIKALIVVTLVLGLASCSSNDSNKKAVVTEIQLDEEGFPVFEIYGEEAPMGYLDRENEITEKYGFRLKRVAGCEIEKEEANRIQQHNREAREAIKAKNGSDWKLVFEKETGLKLAIPF